MTKGKMAIEMATDLVQRFRRILEDADDLLVLAIDWLPGIKDHLSDCLRDELLSLIKDFGHWLEPDKK